MSHSVPNWIWRAFFACTAGYSLIPMVQAGMGEIHLKNTTGPRSGSFVRYEFGEDLLGYYYLDIFRGRRHRAHVLNRLIFDEPREFIYTLDRDLDFREALNYYR